MRIELIIDDARVGAELYDHPVASELVEALPLDLVFNDFNQVEKVATLGSPLTLRGVPDADAPEPGEIGYYAPTQGLVLYYGSPGRWPGLVRMGRFSYDLNTLRALPDGTRIHIAPAPTGADRRLLTRLSRGTRMNRPYVIVHIHTSIDGNIDVMDLPEFEAGSRLYQDIALTPDRQVLNVDAYLNGKESTQVNITHYKVPDVDEHAAEVPAGDFIAEPDAAMY